MAIEQTTQLTTIYMLFYFLMLYYNMDNIELTLEEIQPEYTIAQILEIEIPDDSMVINVKMNFEIPDEEKLEDQWKNLPFYDVKQYVKSLGCEILFSSAGYHLNGERKKPHFHYNFITTEFKIPSNPAQHRHRWANKTELGSNTFLDCTFKFHKALDRNTPKYSVLSYPLKEGHLVTDLNKFIYISNGSPMTTKEKHFLKDVGKTIYEKEQGLKLRQDKCEERKKVALNDLAILLEKNKEFFKTYKEMMIWLDENYIKGLSLEEYPDPRNYKTNCQKIAVYLGKLKYSDIL